MGQIMTDLDGEFPDLVGGDCSLDDVDQMFSLIRGRDANRAEAALGEAGWYDRSALPYKPPTVRWDAP